MSTQTTPSHSQSVEAKVDELMRAIDEVAELETDATLKADATDKHNPDYMAADAKHVEARNKLKDAIRSALASQQEVAAPVSDDDLREALRRIQYEAVSLADAQVIALEALSISRVPVASLAEPATYDKQEIDLLVHRITGQDTAEDSIDALQNAVRILDGKTIAAVVDELYDATQAQPSTNPAPKQGAGDVVAAAKGYLKAYDEEDITNEGIYRKAMRDALTKKGTP